MATAYDVVLRAVSGTPSTVLLYPVNETAADRSAYDVYLYEVHATPSTVVLRRVPGVAAVGGGGTDWLGAGSATIALTTAGAGRRARLGAGSATAVVTTAGAGRRGRFGAGAASVVFTVAGAAARARFGAGSGSAVFTTAGAGLRGRFGAGSATVALTTASSGARSRLGTGATAIVFTSTAAAARIRGGAGSATIRFRAYAGNPYLLEAPMATVRLAISLTVSDAALDTDSTPPVMVVEKTIAGLNSYAQKRLLVNNTTKTLWSSSAVGEALTTFAFLAIWCDTTALELELTCNDADAAEAIFTVSLAPGVPFILGADESRYNPGTLAGSADVIDLIRVKNGAATDAVVNMVYAA